MAMYSSFQEAFESQSEVKAFSAFSHLTGTLPSGHVNNSKERYTENEVKSSLEFYFFTLGGGLFRYTRPACSTKCIIPLILVIYF